MARCGPVIEAECQGQGSFYSYVPVEIMPTTGLAKHKGCSEVMVAGIS